jgi:D-beta-D-heptose 7-phosphate kinase/D-beta-D-heptose 1-phosphate adenosyltransferase
MSKICVIGEFCTDVFIYCETQRLSPEAPVPVLIPKNIKENEGMAGNVVQNLIKLSPKDLVSLMYQNEPIKKTRYVDEKTNHMFIRVDEGEDKVSKLVLTDEYINVIKDSDIVVVSDYNKGFLDLELLETIGSLSKLSILDSKRRLTKKIADSFSFIKLNENESKNNQLIIGCENIIVTLGSKGCIFKSEVFSSPNPMETIDVSGAGDTFTASFILKYYETKNVKDSIIFANEMSSKVVSKRGVTTP